MNIFTNFFDFFKNMKNKNAVFEKRSKKGKGPPYDFLNKIHRIKKVNKKNFSNHFGGYEKTANFLGSFRKN